MSAWIIPILTSLSQHTENFEGLFTGVGSGQVRARKGGWGDLHWSVIVATRIRSAGRMEERNSSICGLTNKDYSHILHGRAGN
jgi:hypothetical protein